MPNTKGGKNYKKNKHIPESVLNIKKIPMIGPDTIYVVMNKIVGGNMTEVEDMNNHKYVGVIPGSMRNRVFINPGDIILIQKRKCSSFDHKYDIIYKYSPEEVKYLKSIGELNFNKEENGDNICFVNDDEIIDKVKPVYEDTDDETDEDNIDSNIEIGKSPTLNTKIPFDRDKRTLNLDDL